MSWLPTFQQLFCTAKHVRKLHICAGPEFGANARRILLIDGGLYGLKTSAASFHKHLSACLQKMDFVPCQGDFDLWMGKCKDHYEYVATYVDDIVFSCDPASVISDFKKEYELKGIGTPEHYFGGNFHTTPGLNTNYNNQQDTSRFHDYGCDVEGIAQRDQDMNGKNIDSRWLKHNVKMTFSAQTYITTCVEGVAKMMGKQDLASYTAPMSATHHPELDDSPTLNEEAHAKFRSLVVCANWLVTLCRFDIAYATNTFSRFTMQPHKGHFGWNGLRLWLLE